jgi:STE24 endopeptidase
VEDRDRVQRQGKIPGHEPEGIQDGQGPLMTGSPASRDASREKEYNKIKLRLSIAAIIVDIILVAVWAFSGISPLAADFIRGYVSNEYAVFLLFMAAAGIIYSALEFPLDFYGSYYIEHRFNLSNQTFRAWIFEKAKSAGVGACIGIPVALGFYFFLKATGHMWWLYFGLFVFLVSVLIARIAPIFIYPIFYKFRDLEPGDVRDKIAGLVGKEGISISGIFSFNLSNQKKKANAGFTGLGKSRRIIISDTLIEKFTPDEIGVVFAHEMGHYKMRHIAKGILLSTVTIFVSFFLCGELYRLTLGLLGYEHVHDVAAIPVLFFYLTVVGLVSMPLSNAVSRRFEWEADRYSLDISSDYPSFITAMNKLADMNLADREPNPVTEFIFYSHPSISKRIAYARDGMRNAT